MATPSPKPIKPLKKVPLDAMNKPSTVHQIAKRVGMTAREVRDIVTAVGTAANATNKKQVTASNKNLIKQVGEAGKTAITGKPGTTSDKATMKMYKNEPNVYTKGKKRS